MLATHIRALIRDLFVWACAIQIQQTLQNGSQKEHKDKKVRKAVFLSILGY